MPVCGPPAPRRVFRAAQRFIVGLALLGGLAAGSARADEVWVAPTYQADFGGVGIGSNAIWPVSVVGAVRFAWAVPDNLQTFQSAKIVLIPHSPGGASTLKVRVCRAENAEAVTAACAGPFTEAFEGVANELLEVDISAMVAPGVGAPGLRYLAVLAFATPTTTTDHIVGLRFVYAPTAPNGLATLGANTFSGAQTAPAFVGDGSHLTNLPMPPGVATLGANVFAGTQRINTGNLDLDGSTATTGNITKDGVRFLHNFGSDNVFLGLEAGNLTTTGSGNAAIGAAALSANTSGFGNTATGHSALVANTNGVENTAIGGLALHNTTTGDSNTAIGFDALGGNLTGNGNVAIGRSAGTFSTTGSSNVYVGAGATGQPADSNTMRLGGQGFQTKTFIAGIRGITTVNNNAIPVLIDSSGQLGTVSSSRRFKEDIHDMTDASSRLFELRPVRFRYAQAYADGSKPLQYGLVAEEVAEAFPELAVRDADGQIETVHYETLNVLLLNELQKQQRRIEALEQRINQLR
jgi:hypothetical protein